MGINLMATYQELMAQREALVMQQANLDKEIADTRRSERNHVIQQIKAQMGEHGISVADLSTKLGRPPKAIPSGDPSRKVAAKYRNALTGEAWSGRGLKPKWLTAAIEGGRKLEEFAV
jgi:DNA-binding protein H-NS